MPNSPHGQASHPGKSHPHYHEWYTNNFIANHMLEFLKETNFNKNKISNT